VTTPREDDRDLVARANAGDAAAFTALYRAHREWVYGLALRLVRDRDDALDVVQESFDTLFGKFPGFALASSIRAFLYPVVRHTAISTLRKKRRIVPLDAAGMRAEAPALGWDPETPSDFDRAIAGLPEEQRLVVRLRFGLDLKLEEIAEALGVPVGTVKSRLHNALQALRAEAG
jgi:RNA polymerase sigma-70 factor, ECF subfamily